MITVLVLVMAVFLVISLLLWLWSPGWRQRIEEPKYRFLGQPLPEKQSRKRRGKKGHDREV